MLKRLIKKYVAENRKIIFVLLLIMSLGIIIGISMYNFSNIETKNMLKENIKSGFENVSNNNFEKIYDSIINNIIFIGVIMTFSMMLHGYVCIYLIYLIKGMAIGVYISTLIGTFGVFYGVIAIILKLVLVDIIYLPAIFYIAVMLIKYNFNVMEYRKEIYVKSKFNRVIFELLMALIIIFSSIIMEEIMITCINKIYNYMI